MERVMEDPQVPELPVRSLVSTAVDQAIPFVASPLLGHIESCLAAVQGRPCDCCVDPIVKFGENFFER